MGERLAQHPPSVDIQPLVDTYNAIYNRDDDDGRPLETDDGRTLAASPLVHTDVEGRLVVTSRHLLVVELREKLLEMLTMLRFARAQDAPIILA